jgi:6-phosphogluconolactonase (cycloisomerase 2 family)
MYGVVYNAADGDLELSYVTVNTFDISTAVYSQSFSVSAQDSQTTGVAFNTDGTKMYTTGYAVGSVNQYTLSTGFDVSTASYDQSLSLSAQDSTLGEIAFNADGTKMFVMGLVGQDVNEYTLSTGFNISTASYSQSFSVASQETAPWGLEFNSDGTKMFIVGETSDSVQEYTLSTGFNVSTASYSQSFSVAAQENQPRGITFNTDGTKMFVIGRAGDDVNEYALSTGFDISTASYTGTTFSVISQESGPTGITFNTDGTKMFVAGYVSDSVNEYSIGTIAIPTGYHPVHTTQSIDSTYWTDINSMTADQAAGDGNVYYAISTDDRTTWTVIDNTDGERDIVRNNAGTWQYNSNGTYASRDLG